ncbi:MAG: hypothetical protein ACI8UO_000275 [Verrucomicrobiales bacterium]
MRGVFQQLLIQEMFALRPAPQIVTLNIMKSRLVFAFLIFAMSASAEPADVIQKFLEHPILDPKTTLEEVQKFTESRVPRMPEPKTAEAWEAEATRMREDVFDRVVFTGEAKKWRERPSNVVWLETIEGGPGYEIRKLRYEILPGMWAPALLYVPADLGDRRVPVVLNVNGHDGEGKAASYKQLRCINLAKRGMIALNAEWIGMGQLKTDGFSHTRANLLNLCGTSAVSPHYLGMSRAIDLLLELPNADPERVAVAGLSGGGWGTIFISSLDTRVALCNPVAGYSSFRTRAYNHSDLGDSEQTPNELAAAADYAQLTAMLAPRAALLTYNANDNCCFAAGHALPPLLEAAEPIYDLYGQRDRLSSHINVDPGDHNFKEDNREAFYRAIGANFFKGQDFKTREIPSEDEIKTSEQLLVELPEDNTDFSALAKRISGGLPIAGGTREQLRKIVRATDYEVTASKAGEDKSDGVKAIYWKLVMNGEWTVPVVELTQGESKGTTIVVADDGRSAAAEETQQLLADGRRVLAVDPYFFGESKFERRGWLWTLMIATVGERALGIQASQTAAVAEWAGEPCDVVAIGHRSGLYTLVAAALAPEKFGELRAPDRLRSLNQVITESWPVTQAPEVFCFDLFKHFDIPQLVELAKGD